MSKHKTESETKSDNETSLRIIVGVILDGFGFSSVKKYEFCEYFGNLPKYYIIRIYIFIWLLEEISTNIILEKCFP